MKKQSLKKSISWLRTYLVTFVIILISFSFLTSEWKSIFRAGEGIYKVARPFAERWLDQLANHGKESNNRQYLTGTLCTNGSC
jgi:hypothetical protein